MKIVLKIFIDVLQDTDNMIKIENMIDKIMCKSKTKSVKIPRDSIYSNVKRMGLNENDQIRASSFLLKGYTIRPHILYYNYFNKHYQMTIHDTKTILIAWNFDRSLYNKILSKKRRRGE